MVQPEQWRIFCAIELPQDVREKVLAHISRLRQAVPEANASWTRPDNIHLTLKFLGEIPQSRVDSLSMAAANASKGLECFPISVQGCGVFPTRGQPRVLWIGIEDLEGKLGDLYRGLEEECSKAGFKREERPFHPHLTLARLRTPQHARMLASVHQNMEFEPVEVNLTGLLVIRSQLSSAGSKYSLVGKHWLQ
ncbi:MAG TPA: RNA 2',3'-cyclic phosphodiesterase [Pyrinomonadaceae bacterium]|nr:RNA 2',3'-cyclic phosphodiesterase [Pyrinomonadaceae bacterium]